VGFEPTIPAFKRTKTVHDLDRAATVIVPINFLYYNILPKNFCLLKAPDLKVSDRGEQFKYAMPANIYEYECYNRFKSIFFFHFLVINVVIKIQIAVFFSFSY
jgi:hypothetical protein